jgi:hypothetical protein
MPSAALFAYPIYIIIYYYLFIYLFICLLFLLFILLFIFYFYYIWSPAADHCKKSHAAASARVLGMHYSKWEGEGGGASHALKA